MYKFKFADIGEGLHEGIVAQIYKKEGDQVNEGDSLFSVETDKITADIPSPKTGKIVKVLMTEGDTIHVGQEIYHIDDGSRIEAETEEPKDQNDEKKAGGASVVGEVKVSDTLLSFDFGQKKSKAKTEEREKEKKFEKNPLKPITSSKIYQGKVDKEFDVIVIGSGPGGYLAAAEAGNSGLSTLIVEKEFWGGVCLNVGCIPTKAMLKTAEVFEYIEQFSDFGLSGNSDLKISWEKMHQRKTEVVNKLVGGVKAIVKSAKATSIFGEAQFVGTHEISVDGKVYRGKNIILATGSTDRKLNLPGFDQGYKSGKILTSKEAINLYEKINSIIIIGGGVIGVEFAQIFSAAGIKVTILQNLARLLTNLDAEISQIITKNLTDKGVKILTNTNILRFENGQIIYEFEGKTESISGDKVLVSIGRQANSAGLSDIGIEVDSRESVIVDDQCRTNIDGVYAIGDLSAKAMLAHVAYRHAVVAVGAILGKTEKYIDKAVPACVYTHPEIAVVGLTEEQAKQEGYDFVIGKASFGHIGKAIASGNPYGFAKLVVDKKYGEIIGAHIIGPVATDLISEIVISMNNEVTVYELASAIHPHPTYSEIIWEAARAAVAKLKKME